MIQQNWQSEKLLYYIPNIISEETTLLTTQPNHKIFTFLVEKVIL